MSTTDDVFAKLGLRPRLTARDYLLPALGIFGFGFLAGAGVMMLLAPQLRGRLRQRFQRGASRLRAVVEREGEEQEQEQEQEQGREERADLEKLSRSELYERAHAMNIDTHRNMSKADLVDAIITEG
ncbi:hypothetical protein [Paraliomyxa miuraensis]|uniref:hypothetical protein n=1 Tax=Paraliomyxa miuraensis TaxID=376150 RepID=UPI0022565F45|nr:hypothetical protein [Paraliomyxa miuraensis]MCX4239244.1 hypothetical protein [Paraliomyxa miuraensis]